MVSYSVLSCIVLFFLCKNFKLGEIQSVLFAVGELCLMKKIMRDVHCVCCHGLG